MSLPYVRWKTGLPCFHPEGSFRTPNPYFGLYPHAGAAHVTPLYAHVAARAFDNPFHRGLLAAWRTKWSMQRTLRKMVAPGR
ncbi:hypothetical protein HK414_09895 [Ramlibacter terrae]|uniref:Uncharacterized protein n=1 Tax=Ramlibacter terrae TaxID=2732511 RepID=A0ABX6P3V0_9BURK|nr:hypothetical protein HK414_09895 [Ramlibacter terrae]